MITILFGADYTESILILRFLAWLPFVISFSQIFGMQVLLNFGMQSTFSKILIVASVLDLTIALPATYFFGVWGTVFIMIAVEIFVSFVTGYYSKIAVARLKN